MVTSPNLTFSAQCEKEPIHVPGAIQPHGVLMVLEPGHRTLLAWSANLETLFPGVRPVWGRPVAEILPPAFLGALEGPLHNDPGPVISFRVREGGSTLLAALHRNNTGQWVLEVEPERSDDPVCCWESFITNTMATIRDVDNLDSLAQVTVDALRTLTGYERVLIYRFDQEGDGMVVAESHVPDWPQSFLGFHFPAHDIPAQARALYLRSRMRYMPDRDYTPVPLVPAVNPENGTAFDLSLSQLRSLSPIHRTYQRNLGVNGSLSVSIINQGKLWGLVVAHHRHPHRLPPSLRSPVALLTDGFALRLSATESAEERDARANHTRLHQRLLEQIAGADDFVKALTQGPVRLTDLFFASGGVAVLHGDSDHNLNVTTVGDTPPEQVVLEYAYWLRRTGRLQDLHATECTGCEHPGMQPYADKASGALAVLLGEARQHMIIWFRPEVIRTIHWGGRPDVVNTGPGGMVLPRESFDRWVEIKRGHARPWPAWKLDIARSLRNALNDLILRQMRAVKDLNDKLRRSDRAKSEFLAAMSHELRTPLNAIIGFSEMLETEVMGPLNPKQKEYAGDILGAGHHLLALINDVLDLSKVEAGRLELHEEWVALAEIGDSVRRLAVPLAENKSVTLSIAIPDSLPRLWADARLVRQMLLNLVSNAIKFTPAGGAVTLTGGRNEVHLWLRVADTGIGIAADQMEAVLQPFNQGASDVTRAQEGTGLGLPLVKSLVEAHGGQLRMESTVGDGTTATLLLPAGRLWPATQPHPT